MSESWEAECEGSSGRRPPAYRLGGQWSRAGLLALLGFGAALTAVAAAPPPPGTVAKMAAPCSTDIDGNDTLDALTDGVLAVRFLLGLRGASLVDGAVGPGASRTSGAQVANFLSDPDCDGMLDVDGNGTADALTDGALLLRFAFGFAQNDLIAGALAPGAVRTTGDDIASWIAYYTNARTISAQGTATPMSPVTDDGEDVRVSPAGDGEVEVTVTEGSDENGEDVTEVMVEEGESEVEFPDPNKEGNTNVMGGNPLRRDDPREKAWSGYDVDEEWARGRALFVTGRGVPLNRLGERTFRTSTSIVAFAQTTYVLRGHCAEADTACFEDRPPVLFIHGYTVGGTFGGREGTWKDFPRLLYDAGFLPFEFTWRTNARFQDVALELAAAIRRITDVTGRQVHLVAHSFGGVLVRTLLQRITLANDPRSAVADRIASLVTIGTPHSGIADAAGTFFGVDLPRGQDTQGVADPFEVCAQISCHQLGEDVFDAAQAAIFGVFDAPGFIAAALADDESNPFPPLDVLSLIGLTTRRGADAVVDEGDALITGRGQRVHPILAVERGRTGLSEIWVPLADGVDLEGVVVDERLLGLPSDVVPGGPNPDPANPGYRHSRANPLTDTPIETFVVRCRRGVACDDHAAFVETRAFLEEQVAAGVERSPTSPVRLRAVDRAGQPVAGAEGRLMIGSSLIDQARAGADGRLELDLVFFPNRQVTLYLNAQGRRPSVVPAETGDAPPPALELGDVVLDSLVPGRGDLVGRVSDAAGQALGGGSYSLRRVDHVRPTRSGEVGADGTFAEGGLVAAFYDLEVVRAGFLPVRRRLEIRPDAETEVTVVLELDSLGGETLRIVLTWGSNPADLNAHLLKVDASGQAEYEISPFNPRAGDDFLDQDDRDGFGPETITVAAVDATARYIYAVNHRSGQGSLATTSMARVAVIRSDGTQFDFEVPEDGSQGAWWLPFLIDDGVIFRCVRNCVGDSFPSATVPDQGAPAPGSGPVWKRLRAGPPRGQPATRRQP